MKPLKFLALSILLSAFACGADGPVGGDDDGEQRIGKESLLMASSGGENGLGAKDDSAVGAQGLRVQNYDTAIWDVTNQWQDTDTPNARVAGLAWGANSGLNWDEKYFAWVDSLGKIDGPTFELVTPWGKKLGAPALECAEVAIFLRITFASWHNLPFFMEAADAQGRVFTGHFGMRRENGVWLNVKKGTNYSNLSNDILAGNAAWPSDPVLKARKIAGSYDDAQPALGGASAGAYFDEIFLNKSVGYFMLTTLAFFGSVNLGDSRNTYNLKPQAILAGDILVKRYDIGGIGHVYIVAKRIPAGEQIEVEVMSGSMPRRQPVWEESGPSKEAFLADATGGPGDYETFGGGLKRWRVAVDVGGRWTNIVMPNDNSNWIDSTDTAATSGRIATLNTFLKTLTREEKRDVYLSIINSKREHLRTRPASCSARKARDDAYQKLTDHMYWEFNMSSEEVFKRYRLFEDEVFAALEYDVSKTCCWNRSTAAMHDIVMQMNNELQMESATCMEPVVFMNRDDAGDGFQIFREYAESIGRGSEWLDWTEDESCSQRDIGEATLLQAPAFCAAGSGNNSNNNMNNYTNF